MMKQYLKTALQSFYRPECFIAVYHRWAGLGFVYIAFIIAVLCIPVGLSVQSKLSDFYSEEGRPFSAENDYLPERILGITGQVRPMKLENGTLSMLAPPKQYTITSPTDSSTLVYIDTSVRDATAQAKESRITVTKDTVYVNFGQNNIRPVPISELMASFNIPPDATIDITPQTLEMAFLSFKRNIGSVSFLFTAFLYVFMTVSYLFRAFIFGFVAMLIAQMMMIKTDLTRACRISAVASTPLIAVDLLGYILGRPVFMFEGVIFFLAHTTLIYIALDTLKKHHQIAEELEGKK